MIFSKTISGYQVYLKENKAIYENIFNDYLNDCLKIIQVFKNTKESQVFLIASSGGPTPYASLEYRQSKMKALLLDLH
ncbi:lipopolysaccharide core heptose(II) kinase RfaY [Helicobacter sp. UBA3407]|uniref:lipopolysaccharide core heptose(II) kinase RfaY n=1 Tax=Helicobacter sp. UBA3407 TaxID=1946588 RepID=UPI00345B5817